MIQIGSTENGSEVLTWKNVGTNKYYDVDMKLNYKTYYVQVKCFDGYDFSDISYSLLVVSKEGNTPPDPPSELTPRYTNDQTPKITWAESYDAEGDSPLTYYIQIGTTSGGDEILKRYWIGYLTYYQVEGNNLNYGEYYVSIFVHDTKLDWSEPGIFEMKIADYELSLNVDSPVKVHRGDRRDIELNITNFANAEDRITITYSDELSSHANLSLSKNNFVIGLGSTTKVTLSITANPDAVLNDYYFKIKVTSEDGETSDEKTIIVTISEPGGTTDGDTDGDDAKKDDDDGGPLDLGNLLQGSFFWLIIILIIILAAVFVYLGSRGKKKREQEEEEARAREREQYDEMYGAPSEQYPPPPPEGADYGEYDYGPDAGDEAWQQEGQPPPPEGAAPEQYYDDYYGAPQDGDYYEQPAEPGPLPDETLKPSYPEELPQDQQVQQQELPPPPPPDPGEPHPQKVVKK